MLFCLSALFSMMVGFLHNFSEQIFSPKKEKEIQNCSIFWGSWSWTSAFEKFFNMNRQVIYRPVFVDIFVAFALAAAPALLS